MEYHEWETLVYLFSPTPIELLFDCQWHNNDFNWFDFRVNPESGTAAASSDGREPQADSGTAQAGL